LEIEMKRILFVILLSTGVAGLCVAHGGGMMGGGAPGQMAGGPGMLTVADDGSLLVTDMSAMMGGGPGGGMMSDDRAIVDISPDGSERWRTTFSDGWPMMPVTEGNLVVLALRDDWWSGWDGTGDGGWNHGGGHGGGGGGGGGAGAGPHADSLVLVGLDLATGTELWRTEVSGGMVSLPEFAPDGSQFYVTVRDLDVDGPDLGGGPMSQGDAPSADQLMSTTVVAIGRDGVIRWSLELASSTPMMGGGQ
jgi:outer membrane protein assembly factor BamB